MNLDEAKELLENAGYRLTEENDSDKFRTAWNSLMSAMSDFTNWNRVMMWYAGNKYEKNARLLCDAYAKGQYSLHEIIEKMKYICMQWYKGLFDKINTILLKNNLEITGDRGEFCYKDECYKIVPVGTNNLECSFEIRRNSEDIINTPQIHSEDDIFKKTPFIRNPNDALDALETIIEQEFNN